MGGPSLYCPAPLHQDIRRGTRPVQERNCRVELPRGEAPSNFPPDSAPIRPSSSRRRTWMHATLFLITLLTALVAGSLFWSETPPHTDPSGTPAQSIAGWISWLLSGWPYAVLLLLILGSHEAGHYVACRFHGIPASLPFFLPGLPPLGTFGAVIRIRGPIPNRRALFDVAAAGPLAGFLVGLPVLITGLLHATPVPAGTLGQGIQLGSPAVSALFERLFHGDTDLSIGSIYGAAWVGMLVTSLNLFPVGQLDGGHAAYAISARLHRLLSRSTPLGVLGLVLYQAVALRTVSTYAVWLVVLAIMRNRHPRLLDEATPLGRGRRLVGVVLVLLFCATFIPMPILIP